MSFSFYKFYDIAAPEQPSVASLMAKTGVINNGHVQVQTVPNSDTPENKETPNPASAPTTAETATTTQPAEQAKPESPKPETKPKPTTEVKVEEPKQISWQEVLKQQQPNAILKELGYDEKVIGLLNEAKGFDPKMVGFLNHWKTNGDLKSYLNALQTDYAQMPALEVMRNQLKEEYPKATDQQLEVLFKKKILEGYQLDARLYSEDEVKTGQLLLEAEAERHRDKLIAKQQEYLLPKAPEAAAPVDFIAQFQKDREEGLQEYKRSIEEHPYYKDVLTNKSLKIGEGEDAFVLPISNVENIVKALLDSDYASNKLSQDGKPNVQLQLLIAALTEDPAYVLGELGKHFKTLGGKAVIDPLENAKPPASGNPAKPDAPITNPAQAMAKSGRIVSR